MSAARIPLAMAGVLFACAPAQARSEVTLHNLTEQDLLVALARGPGSAPLAVATACGGGFSEPRPFGRRFMNSDGLPVEGRPRFEYWLKRGDSAVFEFEEANVDATAEVHLWPEDGKAPRLCHGLLVYPSGANLAEFSAN